MCTKKNANVDACILANCNKNQIKTKTKLKTKVFASAECNRVYKQLVIKLN